VTHIIDVEDAYDVDNIFEGLTTRRDNGKGNVHVDGTSNGMSVSCDSVIVADFEYLNCFVCDGRYDRGISPVFDPVRHSKNNYFVTN